MNYYETQRYLKDMKKWTFDIFMTEIKLIKSKLKCARSDSRELDRLKEVEALMIKWSLIMNYLKGVIDVPANNSDW